MYTCICDLVVVVVVFIHDKHEIKVHCAAMGVKLLLYLHCNYLRHSCTVSTPALPTIKLKSVSHWSCRRGSPCPTKNSSYIKQIVLSGALPVFNSSATHG